MTATNPFQPYVDMMSAFFAPPQLSQSILPGWSLISVNQGNSSAPETEQAVVAKASYGRQLGRIMEALEVVIDATPEPAQTEKKKAIAQFKELAKEVRETKQAAAAARVKRMIDDLESLRTSNPAEFRTRCDALKAFLGGTG